MFLSFFFKHSVFAFPCLSAVAPAISCLLKCRKEEECDSLATQEISLCFLRPRIDDW